MLNIFACNILIERSKQSVVIFWFLQNVRIVTLVLIDWLSWSTLGSWSYEDIVIGRVRDPLGSIGWSLCHVVGALKVWQVLELSWVLDQFRVRIHVLWFGKTLLDLCLNCHVVFGRLAALIVLLSLLMVQHFLLILLHLLQMSLLCLYAMWCDMALKCLLVTMSLRHDRVKQSILVFDLYHRWSGLCLVIFRFFTLPLLFLLQLFIIIFEVLHRKLALCVCFAFL